MKKFIAVFALCTALLSLTACGNQAPLLKTHEDPVGTYVGILKDSNAAAMVVLSPESQEEQLFWMAEGLTCDLPVGQMVCVTYKGNPAEDTGVLTATSVQLA